MLNVHRMSKRLFTSSKKIINNFIEGEDVYKVIRLLKVKLSNMLMSCSHISIVMYCMLWPKTPFDSISSVLMSLLVSLPTQHTWLDYG